MAIGRNPQSAARKWFAAAITGTLSIVASSPTFAFSPWQEEAKVVVIAEHGQVDPPSPEDKTEVVTGEAQIITVPAIAKDAILNQYKNAQAKADTTEAFEQPSKYWIGIALKKVEGDLATHLGSDDGMLVFQVYPDSPAAKAGWKEGDIVLSFNGRVVDDFQPLMEEIGKVENKPTKVVIIRQGAKLDQEITPEPRPDSVPAANTIDVTTTADIAEIPSHLRAIFGATGEGEGNIQVLQGAVQALKGGQMLELTNIGSPQYAFVDGEKIELPKELTITVKKSDESPAKITVTVDGEEASTTEDKVESLPEKAKPFVLRLLAKGDGEHGAINLNGGSFKVFSGKSPQVVVGHAEVIAEDIKGDEKGGEKKEKRRIVVQSKEGDGELKVYTFDSNGEVPEGKVKELVDKARAKAEEARRRAQDQAAAAEDEAKKAVEKGREAIAKIRKEQVEEKRIRVEGFDIGSLKKEIAELKKQLEELKAETAKK